MREVVSALLSEAPDAEPVFLEQSGWLEQPSEELLKSLYAKYRRRFRVVRAKLVKLLGEPAYESATDETWFGNWYPEALLAAAWFVQGKYLCLAVEHADKETPVALVLSCLTEEELAEQVAD